MDWRRLENDVRVSEIALPAGEAEDRLAHFGSCNVGPAWRKRRAMGDLTKWLGISLGLHLAGFAGILFLPAWQVKTVHPIVIDLTLPAPAARLPANSRLPAAPVRSVAPASRQLPAKKAPPVAVKKERLPETPVADRHTPRSMPIEPHNVAAAGKEGSTTTRSATRDETAGSVSAPATAAIGSGTTSTGSESQRYLAEHFSYIRDLVGKHLVYPVMARKMGWSGKAVVVFTIMEDGTASDIRLAVSSGRAILDRSAVETIRRAAPFPKPPLRAEILLPVLFKLQ